MRKGFLKFLTVSFITIVSILVISTNVSAFQYESGTFPENDKHIGSFATYKNEWRGLGNTWIYVKAGPQSSATTSVISSGSSWHISASTGNENSRIVYVAYGSRTYRYAGGLTN